jgi:beta-lactamase class C
MHRKAFLAVLVAFTLLPALTLLSDNADAKKRKPPPPPPAQQPAKPAPVAQAPRARLPDVTASAKQMEHLADELVTQKHLPGLAMAIVQDGKVVSMRGYGRTGGPGYSPVGTDTVFRLASLSKAFAATLSAELVAEGAMSWDDPIVNKLPAFKLRDYASGNKVTVRDILSHRVGLTRNTYDRDLESNQPYPLLAEKLSNAPMACTPGDCYAYQNIAFALIGDVVFASTGDFYSHQVETKIFHPLGMYSSTYGREALQHSASWARPHVRGRGGWVAVEPKDAYYRVAPAAGVNSSIHDMAQWLVAQMGHRPDVLTQSMLDAIHTPQVSTPGELRGSGWRRDRLRHAWYAMGWRVFDYSGHTMVFHGGAVQGYRTLIAFLPKEDVGIVVLWNSESAAPSGLLPSFMDRALGFPNHDWLGVDDDENKD